MPLSVGEIIGIIGLTNVFTGGLVAWINARTSSRKLRTDEDDNLFKRMNATVNTLGERIDQLSTETTKQREELNVLRTENAVLKEGRDGDKARIEMLEIINKAQQRELAQMSKSTSQFLENFRREGCPAGQRCPLVGEDGPTTL